MVTAVSEADIQALILLEVGDTGVVAANMDAIWQSYADKALVAPRLQELYAKRRALDLLLGASRLDVDEGDGGVTLRTSQSVTALLELRKRTEDEIGVVEARAQANRAPAIGLITAVAPISQPLPLPPLLPPDGNNAIYSGTIYRTPRWPGFV